jgi:hypothetical protein
MDGDSWEQADTLMRETRSYCGERDDVGLWQREHDGSPRMPDPFTWVQQAGTEQCRLGNRHPCRGRARWPQSPAAEAGKPERVSRRRRGLVPVTDTQTLNDALMTVAFMVGLVVVILAWVEVASAWYRRQVYRAQIRTIEKYLEHVAEQSPVPVR